MYEVTLCWWLAVWIGGLVELLVLGGELLGNAVPKSSNHQSEPQIRVGSCLRLFFLGPPSKKETASAVGRVRNLNGDLMIRSALPGGSQGFASLKK